MGETGENCKGLLFRVSIECSQNVYFMVGNMEDFLNLDEGLTKTK